MALSLFSAVFLFGAVTFDWAAPAFFLGFLLVALWGGKLLFARTVSWKHAPSHWAVLAFLVYSVVRYFGAPVEYDARLELIRVVFYALIYFAVANNLYHSRDRGVLIGLVGGLAVLESGYALWQVVAHSDIVLGLQRPPNYSGRGSGTLICPNHLAGFLEMAFGLLASRAAFFHGRGRSSDQHAVRKVLIIYAALMAVMGVVMTFSRGGWLATGIAAGALVLWLEGRLRTQWHRAVAAGLLVVLVVGVAFLIPRVWERLNRGLMFDPTAGGRTLMWQATVSMFLEAPWFGLGPASWQWMHQIHRQPALQIHPEYAHSDTLHLLAEYGLVGVALVTAFFGLFFYHVALLLCRKTSSEQRSLVIGGTVAVIAILAHSWGEFNLHIPSNALFLAILTGYVVAMDDPKERFKRVTMGRWAKIGLGVLLIGVSVTGVWAVSRPALAGWFLGWGNDAREILDWDTARAYYGRAVAADPDNPAPYARMGDVYRSQALWRLDPARHAERVELARQAVESYEASLARNPYQTQVLLRLAHVYQVVEDWDNAQRAVDRALGVDPNNALVFLRLGLLHRKRGDEEKAAQAFLRAEELNVLGDQASRANLEDYRPYRKSSAETNAPPGVTNDDAL